MNTPNPKQNGNPMTQQINEALDAKRNARHELWAAIKFLHETQVLTAEEALEVVRGYEQLAAAVREYLSADELLDSKRDERDQQHDQQKAKLRLV